jgi:hypothetical protein
MPVSIILLVFLYLSDYGGRFNRFPEKTEKEDSLSFCRDIFNYIDRL